MKSSPIGTNVALEARPYGACSSHPLCGWLLTYTQGIFSQEAVREWLRHEIERTFRWQGEKDKNTGSIAIATLRMLLAFTTWSAECAADRSRSLLSYNLL